jgi:hypothetical protein
LQDPPKFTKIGIFGLKICYLATLGPAGFLLHGSAGKSGAAHDKNGQILLPLQFGANLNFRRNSTPDVFAKKTLKMAPFLYQGKNFELVIMFARFFGYNIPHNIQNGNKI